MSNGASRPAVLVEDVTVRYRPFIDRTPTLRRSIPRFRARRVEPVVALDQVSFRVERGEAFGVIGPNGAGKSTLLRVMARTLRPDAGRVVVNGRTSTLLQLGVGFNPELSGRQNIYLGGLSAGMKTADVAEVFDDVVEFAGLGSAIDRPIKTYSSGMFSRLAFSVSMHLHPDILLLDEVLAVGDEAFRRKSMQMMREMLDRAGTIVFVSHALPSVTEFCDRVMWLDGGEVRMVGPAEEVVGEYAASVTGPQRSTKPKVGGPWTANQKVEIVLRVLAGEPAATVANEIGSTVDQISRWRRQFIAAGRESLKAPDTARTPDASQAGGAS